MGRSGEPGGEEPPLMPSSHYEYVDRPPRDTAWALAFASFWVASGILGGVAWMHRNPEFAHIDMLDPATCPAGGSPGRGLLEGEEPHSFSVSQFMHLAGVWLLVSAAGAMALGVVFVNLFMRHAHVMTHATIYAQIFVPAASAVALLLSGQGLAGVVLVGVTALTAFVFFIWRNQIALASRLLGVSAQALGHNPHIVSTTVLLNMGSLVACVPLLALCAVAFMNGEPVYNPERHGRATCTNDEGQDVMCCAWQLDGLANAALSVLGITMLWTTFLANQIRVFVTSGAVAQWYFAPPNSTTKGSTMRSLRHALGPSYGTLCFSSAVLTLTELLRQAAERSTRNRDNDSVVVMILKGCAAMVVQCFSAIIAYLTKFATVMAAITGEGFLAAGRRVTDLLVRNLLDAFASTIWFTPLVIQLATFMFSVCWGLLSGGSYFMLHRGSPLQNGALGTNSAILGVTSGLAALFVLSFLGNVLLSVLDAVFVCWAIDKDSQTVSHLEVYAVLQSVPLPGAVVEQPDGDIHYGAEQAPGAPLLYQAPPMTRV